MPLELVIKQQGGYENQTALYETVGTNALRKLQQSKEGTSLLK